MDTCMFNGKQICAYDVVNENMAMNYKLDKQWKIAGKSGELICEECGSEVIFKAKNINKKVPHFAHKNSNRSCYYSNESIKESENHKKGKMLLYTYFRDRYPQDTIRINHRFSINRRADVYIEFRNGDKLAVEYQRSELDIRDWEAKEKDYSKIGIKAFWVMRGEEEYLKKREKQIELSFFQRAMLNENTKTAVYLNVDNQRITLGKNMRYEHPDGFKKDEEELFMKGYNLFDIDIDSKGDVECGFQQEYKKALKSFIDGHDTKIAKDKSIRKKVGKKEAQFQQMSFDFFGEEEGKKEEPQEVISEKKKDTEEIVWSFNELDREETECREEKRKIPRGEGLKNSISFGNNLLKASNGEEKGKLALIRYFIHYASSDDMKMLDFICRYYHLYGKSNIREMYNEVMGAIGFDKKFNVGEEPVERLTCPICGSPLEKKYRKDGEYISCGEYPRCKVSFNL